MDAKAYAARNRQGSDWFTHSAEPALQNDKAVAVTDAPPQIKAQMIKPVCNSNQWFKHADDKDGPRHPEGEAKPASKHEDGNSSACAAWCIGGGGEARGQEVENRTRGVTKEGEANCLRDKTSSDWFSHDPNSSKGHSTPSHRMGSTEGSQNASRMRGESENWFSHDPNAPPEPLHSSKGRQSSKVQGSDMYSVFHHDQ